MARHPSYVLGVEAGRKQERQEIVEILCLAAREAGCNLTAKRDRKEKRVWSEVRRRLHEVAGQLKGGLRLEDCLTSSDGGTKPRRHEAT